MLTSAKSVVSVFRSSVAAEPQPEADSIGHQERKKGDNALTSLVGAQSCCALLASEGAARLRPYGHNRLCAYRRDAGCSIYRGIFVLFVAIDPSRPTNIFEDGDTKECICLRDLLRTPSPVTKNHVQKTRGAIRIARPDIIGGLDDMGAKFRTTIKDLKASQRFRQKQNPLHKFNKPADTPPAKKREKK